MQVFRNDAKLEKHPEKNIAVLSDKDIQYISGRLSRIIGHTKHVRSLVINSHDCSEVLIQLSAVIGNITSIGNAILSQYLDTCLQQLKCYGNMEQFENFKKAMNSFKK